VQGEAVILFRNVSTHDSQALRSILGVPFGAKGGEVAAKIAAWDRSKPFRV
jgi:hypothetical protein